MSLLAKILAPDNLGAAWQDVAENKGAAGVDQVSVKRWSRNWQERLDALDKDVRSGSYQARRMRRFSVPKKDGSLRHLSIPTVTDRVLQRAVLRVVDDAFERVFLDCSHGFRQKRGVRRAIPAIIAQREAGREWVFDADIDHCFESLPHHLIRERFRMVVDDPMLTGLLNQWLKAGQSAPGVGLAMGSVISPLLCNVLLHELDEGLLRAGFHPIRYADDFCVFCQSHSQATEAWQVTESLLAGLELKLKASKTSITSFDEGFDFLGVHFYRDTYSFTAAEKRIEVHGEFVPRLFHDYVLEGYED